MPTTWDGETVFNGDGVLAASALVGVDVAVSFSGEGSLVALGIKPPNRIAARFAGSSSITIATIAPRLVASAAFVGNGLLAHRSNAAASILSTAASVRYSFPTVPNPGDPFVRRPSRDYSNYSISVRFTGSGRVTALAS